MYFLKIKVFIMTSILVFVFGKYNESEDFEVDCNDGNQPINNSFNKDVKKIFNEFTISNLIR
jgi:hypothetical protein